MLKPIIVLLLHFLLTTTVNAYSDNAVYQPPNGKGEHLLFNLRSGIDTERSTRRIFAQSPIRFGGRSDIPPLVGKELEYEAMLDDDMDRERRAFSKTSNHMRFGRANSNFLRFGRSRNNNRNDYNRLTRANNSLFMRFGRGRSDFIRFGRSEEYARKKRDATIDEEKRGNSNFMRYGKRYDGEEYLDDEDDREETLNNKLQDALFFKLLSQISCNVGSGNCDRLD